MLGVKGFLTVAVLVAEAVEAWAVVHFGKVSEFVKHDIVAQMLRQEQDDVGERYVSVSVAMPQNTMSA